MSEKSAVTGSFRDPSGYVFQHSRDIYRCINDGCWQVMKSMKDSGLLSTLISEGLLVGTELVVDDQKSEELKKVAEGYRYFLQHEEVPFISYPYEWPASMLASAAMLQLDLQRRLLRSGYSLKDATAYNIQFRRSKPVFIDVASIECPDSMNIWVAYGQFCRMFLFPLLLHVFHNHDLRGYYLANIEGMDVGNVSMLIGRLNTLHPRYFLDVFLQSRLQIYGEKQSGSSGHSLKEKTSKGDPEVQDINLSRLYNKIRKIAEVQKRHNGSGHWVTYAKTHSYSNVAEAEKENFVKSFLASYKPGHVLDMGCNTGQYSIMAAESGAQVVAIDSDHDSVDSLYSRLQELPRDILPLRVDIANPSPAIGFNNVERSSFMDRSKHFDCVFALALIHHLLVSSRIPLPDIRDLFYRLTSRWLVVEFVDRKDAMFQQLLALRKDIYEHITLDYFRNIFKERFTLIREMTIPETKRTLFLFRKE